MLRVDLKTAVQASERLVETFKRENVFNSKTLHEMFSPKFTSDAGKIYAKSRLTGEPVEVFVDNLSNIQPRMQGKPEYGCWKNYIFKFFDSQDNRIGSKRFQIECHPNPEIDNHMLTGDMENIPCGIAGLGVIEDAMQIEAAMQHGISKIPRDAIAKATLYHTRMGFLPTQDLTEIKSYDDVIDILKNMMKKSPDIKPGNFKPIIVEKEGKYFLDKNATQAHANVREIKERLQQDGGYRLTDLKAEGTELELSGEELNFWSNLLEKHSFLDKIG